MKTVYGLLVFSLKYLQGNEGWSFRDVLPYFKKSENNLDDSIAADKEYHAVGGYQSVSRFPYQDHHMDTLLEGFKELGLEEIDYNAGGGPGVMLTQATHENGERRSTSRSFLSPVLQRKNLKVITGAIVTKLLIHPENKISVWSGVCVRERQQHQISGTCF